MSRGDLTIIGAPAAAATLIGALRDAGDRRRIHLVGDETRPPYERPPLSKPGGATAPVGLLDGDGAVDDRLELHLGRRATALDPSSARVELDDGSTLVADRVVVATGSAPRRLSCAVPGRVLRTFADAVALDDELRPGARVVVVGFGLIGSELASLAAARGCEVTVVDPSPAPLERQLGALAAVFVRRLHRARGVRQRFGHQVVAAEPAGTAVRVTLDDRSVDADVLIAAIGCVPNVELATSAGLSLASDGGIAVDASCRTSAAHVLAIGDVASRRDPVDGVRHRDEHQAVALAHARIAAAVLLGRPSPLDPVPWFATEQHGTRVTVSGRPRGDDTAVVRGDLDAGDATVFHVRQGRVSAAVSLDRAREAALIRRTVLGHRVTRPELLGDGTCPLQEVVA